MIIIVTWRKYVIIVKKFDKMLFLYLFQILKHVQQHMG